MMSFDEVEVAESPRSRPVVAQNNKAGMFHASEHFVKELEIIEEVEERYMPLPSYTWTHGELSDEDIQAIVTWGKQVRAQYRSQIQSE